MGMMARMRSLAPWFIITVGGVFVLFMVLSDSKVANLIGQRTNNIGTINGKEITYQDFSQIVDQEKERLEKMQAGFVFGPAQMPALRDRVWENLVTEAAIDQKIEEYGITVSDDEIRDILLGENPPEFLTKDFIDSTGNFNRSAYEAALFNPANKQNLIYIESMLKLQRRREKLKEYITSTVIVTDDEVRTNYERKYAEMSAEFVKISAYSIPDSMISVTDDEIKSYYDEHKEDYKKPETRKLKFVVFEKKPTAKDTSEIYNNLVQIKKKLLVEPDNFRTYVDIYSTSPHSVDTISVPNNVPDEAEFLINAKKGDIGGPFFESLYGFTLVKVIDKIKSNDLKVEASHILLQGDNAKKEAMDLYRKIKAGADFAKLAKEKSTDKSNSDKGGYLGWFAKGTMVDEFWQAAKRAKIGAVTRPVKTQFGYHLILVKNKTKTKFIVEKIVNKIEISPSSVDKLNNDANDFAYLAKKEGFEKIAKEYNKDIIESGAFREDSRMVPGLGYSNAIVKFGFENSRNEISKVFNVEAGYAVAYVSDIIPAGYRDFEKIKGSIRSKLVREKKLEKAYEIAKLIRERIVATGNMDLAKEIFKNAYVGKAEKFDGLGLISGVGREPAFVEYAMTAKLNEISKPIRGTQGTFLIKLTYRKPFNETEFTVQKTTLKKELLNNKRNTLFNEWLNKIAKEVDVEDNRYKFFY